MENQEMRALSRVEAIKLRRLREWVEKMDEATLYYEVQECELKQSGSPDELRNRLLRYAIRECISKDLAAWNEEQDVCPERLGRLRLGREAIAARDAEWCRMKESPCGSTRSTDRGGSLRAQGRSVDYDDFGELESRSSLYVNTPPSVTGIQPYVQLPASQHYPPSLGNQSQCIQRQESNLTYAPTYSACQEIAASSPNSTEQLGYSQRIEDVPDNRSKYIMSTEAMRAAESLSPRGYTSGDKKQSEAQSSEISTCGRQTRKPVEAEMADVPQIKEASGVDDPLRNHHGAEGEMPNRPQAAESKLETCRICLETDVVMWDLRREERAKVESFAKIVMLPDDGLPARICNTCANRLDAAYEFKLQIERADSILRERCGISNAKEADEQSDMKGKASIRKMQKSRQETVTASATQDVEEPTPSGVQSNLARHQGRSRSSRDIISKRQRLPRPASGTPSHTQKSPSSFTSSGSKPSSSGSLQSRNPYLRSRTHTVRHSSTPTVVVGMQLRGNGACWRCGQRGHTHRECQAPKRWKYCYLCGERHVRVSNCPQCSASWRRGHQELRLGSPPNSSPERGRATRPYGQIRNFGPYAQTNCRPYGRTNYGLYGQTIHVT